MDESPADGAYLTDGRRLAQVLGLTANQDFVLEDCSEAFGEGSSVIVVSPEDLSRKWMTVAAFERRKGEVKRAA